jgi:hypothetical protein
MATPEPLSRARPCMLGPGSDSRRSRQIRSSGDSVPHSTRNSGSLGRTLEPLSTQLGLPVAGVLRVGLAGPDYTIVCTLRAAVRQPAPAGCRAAARGGSPAPTTPSSALYRPQSGSRLRPVPGLRRAGGLLAPTTPPSALYGPPFGSRLRPVAGLQHMGGSPAPTTPSAAFYGPHSDSRFQPVAGLRHAGAHRIRLHHLPHSLGHRPAAGSCREQGCCARGACWLRHHHPLHSAGRRPAAGSGRLLGCCA